MTPVTDEQVILCLAKRQGVGQHLHYVIGPTAEDYKCGNCGLEFNGRRLTEVCPKSRRIPDYLTSRDALAPILAGLKAIERLRLMDKFVAQSRFNLLTLPTRDLAYAIAAVLVGGKEGSK